MVSQTPQPVHARYFRHACAFVHFCVGDAAEFGEEGVDDPGVVVAECGGGEEVEGEGGEEVEGGLDVRLECEGEGARDGLGIGRGGEIAPEVFGLGEGEGVEGLRFGHGDCAGEEEGVEGGGGGVRGGVVGRDGVVLKPADCGVVE